MRNSVEIGTGPASFWKTLLFEIIPQGVKAACLLMIEEGVDFITAVFNSTKRRRRAFTAFRPS